MTFLAATGADHGAMTGVLMDLGLVIVGAAIAALVASRLRLPLIFGYLLAGVLLGPNTTRFSPVQDLATIQQISNLGVIFLLFFIGMEFDLRRLRAVAGPALIALFLQTVTMMNLAQLLAGRIGWSPVEAVFFGSLLAISSSMVTIKVLREQDRIKLPHAQLAIGILILEDVLAVILLVILSGVAVTQQFAWDAAWLVTFLVGVFVTVVFVIGRLIAPRLLDRLAVGEGMDEQITICSIGMVMAISLLALNFNFSEALGAFIAGAILSQTKIASRIESSNRSLHDLFAAVFFVTIGMLINPREIVHYGGWILLFSLLVILGKILSCWLGLFLGGQPSRSSFRASVAKGQIGEFSFIIAALGGSLGVTGASLTNIAFGVALVTILLTPYLSLPSLEVYNAMVARTPAPVLEMAKFYRRFLETVFTVLGRNILLRLIKRPLSQIAVYFLLVNGILFGALLLVQRLRDRFPHQWLGYDLVPLVIWVAAAAMVAPLIIAMLRNLGAIIYMLSEAIFASRGSRPLLQGRLLNFFNGLLLLLIILTVGLVYLAIAGPYLPGPTGMVIFLGILVVTAVIFWRRMIRLNSRIEYLFMESFALEALSVESDRRAAVLSEIREKYPWPIQLQEFRVEDAMKAAGQRIVDLSLRSHSGASIIAIRRGHFEIFDPGPETPVFPGDSLLLFGTEEQMLAARALLSEPAGERKELRLLDSVRIEPVYLSAGTELDGNTLAGADVRRRHGISIIGVQRGESQITSPAADFILKAGDVVYVVGAPARVERFRDRCSSQEAGHQPA